MYFATQAEYVAYHSPEARAARIAAARQATDAAVADALHMHNDGDVAGARDRLFDAGIGDDGISYYLGIWSDPYI